MGKVANSQYIEVGAKAKKTIMYASVKLDIPAGIRPVSCSIGAEATNPAKQIAVSHAARSSTRRKSRGIPTSTNGTGNELRSS